MQFLMGVDLGTSSCKVAVLDDKGRVLATSQEAIPTQQPRPGWIEQDPEDWYRACVQAIQRCLTGGQIEPSHIAALSICGPAHSATLLDESGRVVRPVIMWADNRSISQARWLQQQYGEQIFTISYQPVHASWTLAQLLWIRQNEPHVWQHIRRIMLCKDYITYRLTGSWQTDSYDAMGTQLLDVSQRIWSKDLADLIDLPLDYLPPLRNPTDVAGVVSPQAAEETGLLAGTPVAVGSGDSVVEALGAGVIEPGQCIVKLATSGTVNVVGAEPRPHHKVMTYCHVVPNRWYTITAINYAAAAVRWFTETFSTYDSSALDELAASVCPGSEGLIFHPYLQGERSPYWDPHLRGDFVGITARHQMPHFARAVLEGVAFALRDCLETLRSIDLPTSRFCIMGGGARSAVWRQIVADVLGVELLVPAGDATTYGAALLAGVARGKYGSVWQAAQEALPIHAIVYPNDRTRKIYEDLYPIYRQITASLTPAYHALATLRADNTIT